MKTKKQYYMAVGAVFVVMLLLNGVLFYSSKCSGEYLQSENVWGVSQYVKASDYSKRRLLIEELPENPEQAMEKLRATVENRKLWEEESKEDYDNYTAVLECVESVVNYGNYVRGIEESISEIAQVLYPMYEDAWLLKSIARCEQDYSGLEYRQLEVMMDNTVNVVIGYHVTDILAFLFLALLAAALCYHLKNDSFGKSFGTKRVVVITLFLMAMGTAGMYVTNFCTVGAVYGSVSLSAPVQSLNEFYTCPYNVTVGGFLTLYVVCKVLTLLLLLAISFLAVTGRHRMMACTVAVAGVSFELWSCVAPADTEVEKVLQELNLFSGLTPERFFNRYLNLNLAERVVPRVSTFFILFALLFLVMLFWVYRRFTRWHKISRQEAMNSYFVEIDRKYQESRMLWHDFQNHLLAVKALYENGREEQAVKYIDALSEQSYEWLLPAKTGSDTLDLLLFKKYKQAHESGIKLQLRIGCSLSGTVITEYDLCSLFGNILDNAIEAVQKLEGRGKEILLRVEKQNSMLFISCENPYDGELEQQEGELKTTKRDRTKHGIGLSSVRKVCKKYQGNMELETENGVFRVSLLLNL